jgi:poly(3-hydroxybutyrate) depolymerase
MKKMNVLITTFIMILLSASFVVAQRPQEQPQRFTGYLQSAGRAEKLYKGDQFIKTETARNILISLYYLQAYGLKKQDDPAITAYWNSKGLKKEIYEINDTNRMWSVFTPNGIYDNYDKDHKFPVVFCLHGNNNNILMAETYGFAELGGKEGFITIVPWAQNEDIILDEVPRILKILHEKNYPIDESRIYATGFSKGGAATMRVGITYPETFAAIAPGGAGPASIVGENDKALTQMGPNLGFTASQYANAAKFKMPVLFFGGTCDNMPLSANAANWIGISGAIAPRVTEETVANVIAHSGYGVERMTGLQFDLDKMKILPLDGTYYYVGSYYNEDGVCTFRTVAVEGAPHWLVKSEAAVVWEFLSQFARDKANGKLLYTK